MVHRLYLSEEGNDSNAGTRASPMRTFAGALPTLDNGGWITCLDGAEYGPLTIDRSVTIDARVGGVITPTGNAINAAGAYTIQLLGLTIEGSAGGTIGLNITGAATVYADGLVIRGFTAGSALGINFAPPPATFGRLHLRGPMICDCGINDVSGGILVKPNNDGRAFVTLERPQLVGNSIGLLVDGNGLVYGAPRLDVEAQFGVISGNVIYGIACRSLTPSGIAVTRLDQVMVCGNGTPSNGGAGVLIEGGSAYVLTSRTTINRNPAGIKRINGGYWGSDSASNFIAGNTPDSATSTDFTGDGTGQKWSFGVQ